MSTEHNPSLSLIIDQILERAEQWGPILLNPMELDTEQGQQAQQQLERARLELQSILCNINQPA